MSRLTGGLMPMVGATVLIVGAIVPAAMWAAVQFSQIKATLEHLPEQISVSVSPLSVRINALEREIEHRTRSRWTRTDQELWCLKTQQLNPTWRCADHIGQGVTGDTLDSPPIWSGSDSWRTSEKPK